MKYWNQFKVMCLHYQYQKSDSDKQLTDGYIIRRCAAKYNVTTFTSLDTVSALLDVLEEITIGVSTIDSDNRIKIRKEIRRKLKKYQAAIIINRNCKQNF